jgi:cobalt-zinc-cadmium resistance protein CzcA
MRHLAVALIIPLALLFAFIMMDAKGVSANLISLGTVDFGIIIDSAVVLVEALMVKLALAKTDGIEKHLSYGWRLHLIKQTSIELGRPILFSKGDHHSGFLADLHFSACGRQDFFAHGIYPELCPARGDSDDA